MHTLTCLCVRGIDGLRRSLLASAAAIALACLTIPVAAQAPAGEDAPEILWYFAATPPLYITSGELKGQGYLDRMLEEVVIPALPEYRHRRIESALPRALQDIQNRPGVCILGLYKTEERAGQMLFSQSFASVLPISIVLRAGEQSRFSGFLDAKRRVVLRSLLGRSTLRLGLVTDRSYGSEIDGVLGEFRGSGRIESHAASEASANLVRRLDRGHGVDFVLAYPYELRYLEETGALQPGRLHMLPIAEAPAILPGYTACARSGQGSAVISRIDKQFASAAVKAQFQRYYERWLDEAARKRLQEGLKRR